MTTRTSRIAQNKPSSLKAGDRDDKKEEKAVEQRRMRRRSEEWGVASEEWRIKPNYEIKPKNVW